MVCESIILYGLTFQGLTSLNYI